MQLTNQQLETLKGKCPRCEDRKEIAEFNKNHSFKRMIECPECLGTGKATIEMVKEK